MTYQEVTVGVKLMAKYLERSGGGRGGFRE